MYAILYGQQAIMQYTLRLADEGLISLHYVLCDAFKVMREEVDNNTATDEEILLNERSSLLPLVICLMTGQAQMLNILWNYPNFYSKPHYLVLLSNMVYETENPAIIKTFLLSQKTKDLFNHISLAEK